MHFLKNNAMLLLTLSFFATPVFAYQSIAIPNFQLSTLFEQLQTFLSSRLVSILTMALVSWHILYTLFRIILEQGGRSTEAYSHAIALVASFILTSTWIGVYMSNPEIKGFFRAAVTGWPGLSITIAGTVGILWVSYYTLTTWSQSSMPPSP